MVSKTWYSTSSRDFNYVKYFNSLQNYNKKI